MLVAGGGVKSQFETIVARMRRAGATSIYAKPLAPNDNSKNQIYLAPDPAVLSAIPSSPFTAAQANPGILKASVDLYWLADNGGFEKAPFSQLIYYPQYPEVRLSGILRGCTVAPNEIIASRHEDRYLVLGMLPDERILASAGFGAGALGGHKGNGHGSGVLRQINTEQDLSSREILIRELGRIHKLNWLNSSQLYSDGRTAPCAGPRSVGLTLEAQLGIPQNGICGPDFLDWEIKAQTFRDFRVVEKSKAVTLITPAPSGGFYREAGPREFMRRFGYAAENQPDRINFGGRFFYGRTDPRTGLTLTLAGYDLIRAEFPAGGGIQLVTPTGVVAAEWDFALLATKWKAKHSNACYVPAEARSAADQKQFRYGPTVRLGANPLLGYLLRSIVDGSVYFDPGIKLTDATSSAPKLKERHQFRIGAENISRLYLFFEEVQVA